MKHIFYISILLFAASCSLSKKTSTRAEQSIIKDTASTVIENRSNTQQIREKETRISDTVIGISGKTVADTINKEDTYIPRTQSGKAVPRHYETKDNGLRAWVTIDTNGNVLYGAEADSMTLVIHDLVQENERLTNIAESLKVANIFSGNHSVQTSEYAEFTRQTFIGWAWPWILGAVVLAIIFFIIKKYF